MATMAGMFALYHGPEGIRKIALKVYSCAHAVADMLRKGGYKLAANDFFDTIEIIGAEGIEFDPAEINTRAEEAGINFCYTSDDTIIISFDELSTCEEAAMIAKIFGCVALCEGIPAEPSFMKRETPILTSEIFNKYHSETELMRYIKKLERRDISLTHSMIPLGSCTMKLNAAVEVMPMSWSEFGNLHPFAPTDQVEGTLKVIKELERDLAVITGLDGCSLQPNSGAAGEFAGLMTHVHITCKGQEPAT